MLNVLIKKKKKNPSNRSREVEGDHHMINGRGET
jgi:hypothetical protein